MKRFSESIDEDPQEIFVPFFKFSNHDVAYHMGMMDTLTIMFERGQNLDKEEISDLLDIPKALFVALDARRRFKKGTGDFRDSAKAATMAQRSVEDISYHAGSMPDVVIYTIEGTDGIRWTWAPSFTTSVTQRSKTPPSSREYHMKEEAQQAAEEFATKVQEVSRWADSGIRRSVQTWTQRRQRTWSNTAKDGRIHAELCPLSIGNFVVVYRKFSTAEPEIAIETMMLIINYIDTKEGCLIHLGTVECPENFIVMYGVVTVKTGKDSTKSRHSVKRDLETIL